MGFNSSGGAAPAEKIVKEAEVPNGESIVRKAREAAMKAEAEKKAAVDELDSCKQRLSEQVNRRHETF